MENDITYRPRRMRQNQILRRLIKETRFSLDQLVMPYFVHEGKGVREAIQSMPGQYRFSPDALLKELDELTSKGIRNILLFGIPQTKDEKATSAWSSKGIVQRTLRGIKKRFKNLLVMTDVCLCAYMSHGHCGILNSKGEIDNDSSLKILSDVALSHAEAGSDMIAPSDMMDGRIRTLRQSLDSNGFKNLSILSYAAKYASAFYGPFRDAAHSHPQRSSSRRPIPSDRKTYQMDPSNRKEALREIALDIQEGADMIMVKPALAYLDVIHEAVNLFHFPMAAYSVSGEYSMIKAAAKQGFIDEKSTVYEIMTSIFRAGAQVVLTYHAKDLALWEKNRDRSS